MTITRKIWLMLAALGILFLGGTLWLIGTESGARWVFARVAASLPKELAIVDIRGSLLRGLRIRSVQWRGASLRVGVDDVFLDAELIPLIFSHLDVNELTIARFELELRETGEPDTAPGLPTVDLPVDISIAAAHLRNVSFSRDSFAQSADEISLAGSLFGSDLSITRLQFESPRLRLNLNGSVKLADRYASRARVAWQWQQTDELQFAGDLQVQGDVRRYNLRNLLTAPVALSTSGNIQLDAGTLFADLTNEWQSLDFSIGNRRLQSPGGSLRVQGNPDDYQVSLSASARVDELPETRVELSGNAGPQAIRISHLGLVNEIGDLSANGIASWLPEQTFDLDFSLSGLDPSRVSDAVTGTLNFSGNVNGSVVDQTPQIDLRIAGMSGNVNGYLLEGDGIVAYARDTLTFTDTRVRIGSNNTEFSGSFGETISLDADLDFASLSEILPDASGALRGRVTARGALERPNARIDLTATAFRWAEYSIGNLSVDASIRDNQSSVAELELREISIRGTTLDSVQIAARGMIDRHMVRVGLRAFESELSIDARGGWSQRQWSGRIGSLAISNDALGRWTGNQDSELVVSVEEIMLSETCLFPASDPGRACFAGAYGKDRPVAVDFSLTDFPLSAIPVELPADANVSGFIDARLNVQSRERRLTGSAGIELRQAMFDASYEGEPISVSFANASGEATITDNRTDSTLRLEMADGTGAADLHLNIEDLFDRQSAIGGQGNVSLNDVSLFAVFLPGITNPRGRIEGGLSLSGTLGRPEFLGEVVLTEGSFGVRQAGIDIVDVDVRLSQRAPGQLQIRGRARSGDGQIRLRGETFIGTDSGIRSELTLTGDNFELARLPEWQVAASPSIRAIFDERTIAVSGALGIPAASITVTEIPETAESPSPDAIVHRAEGTEAYTGRRIALDVTTVLGSEVRFSGFGLTAGVEGAVRLQGGTRQPWTGNGTLNLREGRYKAYGQELDIERGVLLFNGPLDNPQLDIRAIRHADDVVAGIQLSGTPSRLRSQVFSEPAMSDAEALSYLLTGRPLSSTANAGQGDILNNAAFALGMSGAGTIASQVRSGLGLETLTVEGGSDNGRIVAGKRFGDRLLVEYGYGLIDKLGTLLLRYQLTDRIVLESRTGTVSNMDVVYSVKKQ